MSSKFGPYDIKPPSLTSEPYSYMAGMLPAAAKSSIRFRLRNVSASVTSNGASGRSQLIGLIADPGHVSTGPGEACHQSDAYGITGGGEHDRNGRRCRLDGIGGFTPESYDQIDLRSGQVRCKRGQPFGAGFGPLTHIDDALS